MYQIFWCCRGLQKFGADGITIHPRPDERHITKSDVFNLKPLVHTEYNIEGYPSRDFIDMVISVNLISNTCP